MTTWYQELVVFHTGEDDEALAEWLKKVAADDGHKVFARVNAHWQLCEESKQIAIGDYFGMGDGPTRTKERFPGPQSLVFEYSATLEATKVYLDLA